MLHFLVTADHSYTLKQYFSQWGANLRPQVRILKYEAKPWTRDALLGTWIFTDLERLRDDELQTVSDFAQRLTADPSRWRVLNDPRRVLLRYALLRDLAAAGINDFRAFKLSELPDGARYPLFLRRENDHAGAATDLLHDPEQLQAALRNLPNVEALLAVEYLPYQRSDGLFLKYSMMRIGTEMAPRHIHFSRHWLLKNQELVDEPLMQEEDLYVRESPHRQMLWEVFQRAGIDYGRIDYTMANDRIQVFEINTNPILLHGIQDLAPRRWESQVFSAQQMNDAFSKLDAGIAVADPAQLEADHRAFRRRIRIHNVLRKLAIRPGARR